MRRAQQPVDLLLVSILALILEKRVDLFDRGRQPDQIETQPPQKSYPIGLRRSREPFLLKASQNKTIDRIRTRSLRERRTLRRNEGPVLLALSVLDPLSDHRDLGRRGVL